MASPIRPVLYDRLCRRASQYGFGEVKIVHENEEMSATVEEDLERPGRKKLNVMFPGEYYLVSCPFCTDTRHRLWINHRWGLWNEQTRSLNLWLAVCYNEMCLQSGDNARQLYRWVFDDVTNSRDAYDPVRKGDKPSARKDHVYRPAGSTIYPLHALHPSHHAVQYVVERGYDPQWLGRVKGVGYCMEAAPEFPAAYDRIIIPVYYGGLLVGWQARYVGDAPKGTPKYYTMPNMKKNEVLYNYDVARGKPFGVLTEGVTKVWSVGDEAVAQLGDKLSSWQAKVIVATWRTVVIYLDGDALNQSMMAHDALYGVPNRVVVSLPPGKEPGDFSIEYNRELIKQQARKRGLELPI